MVSGEIIQLNACKVSWRNLLAGLGCGAVSPSHVLDQDLSMPFSGELQAFKCLTALLESGTAM